MEKKRGATELKEANVITLKDLVKIDEEGDWLSAAKRCKFEEIISKRLDDVDYVRSGREGDFVCAVKCSVEYLRYITGIDLTKYKIVAVDSYAGEGRPCFVDKKLEEIVIIWNNIYADNLNATERELEVYNTIFFSGFYLRYKGVMPKSYNPSNRIARYEWRGSMESLGELFAMISLHLKKENAAKDWSSFVDEYIDLQVIRQKEELKKVDVRLWVMVERDYESDVEKARESFQKSGNFRAYIEQKLSEKPDKLRNKAENLYCSVAIAHVISKVIAPYKSFIEMQISQRVDDLDTAGSRPNDQTGKSIWIV